MTTMDQAVELLRTVIRQEDEAQQLIWTSTDTAEMDRRVAEVNKHFGGGLLSEVARPRTLRDDHLQRGQKQLRVLGPRLLFKVERYDTRGLGPVFRAYVSSHLKDYTTYAASLLVADQGEGPRIVSQYNLCWTCEGSGKAGGKTCPDCGGAGWLRVGGLDVGDLRQLGEPVEVRKIQPPSDSKHLADYEAR